MADVVTSQLLENGPRRWAYSFTGVSDGTGETAVVKVDGSSTGPLGVVIAGRTFYPGIHIKITEIEYDVSDMVLQVLWDATSPVQAEVLGGSVGGKFNYCRVGGLVVPPGLVGATGKILFTSLQPAVNGSYSVRMFGTKGIQQ